MGGMKAKLLLNLAPINILDAFVTGAYTLAVPLLMVKRNISYYPKVLWSDFCT
ncbi:MAG: hypothetical protein QXO32_08725 [Candidatus Bathyarchaeia archaeon]